MLRLLSPIRRRHDLDLAQFGEHWSTVHRALALRLVDAGIMRGYVQNHRLAIDVPGLAPPGDGVPELWVEGVEALEALAASPAYLQGAALDEPNFMEGEAHPFVARSLVREPSLPRQAVAGKIKLMLFFNRRSDVDGSAVAEAWLADGLILAPEDAIVRAELHVAIDGSQEGGFTHVECLWWVSRAAFENAWALRNEARTIGLIDPTSIAGMLVSELPVLWPEGDPVS
jgi:hypothetical protein